MHCSLKTSVLIVSLGTRRGNRAFHFYVVLLLLTEVQEFAHNIDS